MATTEIDANQTVSINRQVKAHLDAADRELMVADTVKSSAELWAAVRLAAVITMKKRGLPHGSDQEITASMEIMDTAEGAKRRVLESYQAAKIFHDNATHDFLDLDEFLFCRPGATEFVDLMQELYEKSP